MSAQIREERGEYYGILERTQRGTMDITAWMEWFLGCSKICGSLLFVEFDNAVERNVLSDRSVDDSASARPDHKVEQVSQPSPVQCV